MRDLDALQEQTNSQHKPELGTAKRRIIKGVGAFGLGVVLGAHTLNAIGDVVQNSKTPEIRTYSSSAPSKESLVAFSGLGGYGPDLYCTLNAIDPRDVWGVYHNGQFDLSLESQMIIDKAEQTGTQELTILGDSAGGLMAIKVGANIVRADKVGVSEVHLVTTPISEYDIRSKEKMAFDASSIAVKLGGFGARLFGEAAVEFNKDYADGWVNSISSVWDRSIKMPSNVLKAQQDLIKQGVDIEDLRILIKNGTKIVYFAPQDSKQDRLVNTDWAYNRLEAKVKRILAEEGINANSLNSYLSLVRVGDRHSPLAHSEYDLVNGAWAQNTNAVRANYPYEIKALYNNQDSECKESLNSVIGALGLAGNS